MTTILLLVFVGFGAFGLGRFSAMEHDVPEVKIEENASISSGAVVASKSGTKYHFPWCGGALRILESNKIEFESMEKAREAGYTPAQNCKGLE